jgi:hypothetical protein
VGTDRQIRPNGQLKSGHVQRELPFCFFDLGFRGGRLFHLWEETGLLAGDGRGSVDDRRLFHRFGAPHDPDMPGAYGWGVRFAKTRVLAGYPRTHLW